MTKQELNKTYQDFLKSLGQGGKHAEGALMFKWFIEEQGVLDDENINTDRYEPMSVEEKRMKEYDVADYEQDVLGDEEDLDFMSDIGA